MFNEILLAELVKNSILNYKKISIEDLYNNDDFIIIDSDFMYDKNKKIYYSVYIKDNNVFLFPLPNIYLGG